MPGFGRRQMALAGADSAFFVEAVVCGVLVAVVGGLNLLSIYLARGRSGGADSAPPDGAVAVSVKPTSGAASSQQPPTLPVRGTVPVAGAAPPHRPVFVSCITNLSVHPLTRFVEGGIGGWCRRAVHFRATLSRITIADWEWRLQCSVCCSVWTGTARWV